jgi:hypothetical protein
MLSTAWQIYSRIFRFFRVYYDSLFYLFVQVEANYWLSIFNDMIPIPSVIFRAIKSIKCIFFQIQKR